VDGNEVWIGIIEKGYAKLYGDYSNICAGQIPLALADLNYGGFPETTVLTTMQSNPATFMTKL
jgi:predicted transcriptional regulator